MPLLVFDPSITCTSPAGSCLLNMLEPVAGKSPLHLFIQETDLPDAQSVRKTKIPLPRRPVFVRAVLYTIFSTCAYFALRPRKAALKISTEGAFPFCDLCYAHFCHRFFLRRHRESIGGGWFRRGARFLTHGWGAFTERIAFRSAKTIVVPSHGIAREIKNVYPNLTQGKVRVIPNPVDAGRFSRPSDFTAAVLRQRLHIPQHAFVLSFCALGNFERKGLRLVLEALVGTRDLPTHLIVVGGTQSEIREFTSIAERLRVAEFVHFVGLQTDVRPYLWSSHTFVFPSAYEGFALVCLQAAAAGLPLIATAVSGMEDFIDSGVNGWNVDRTSDSIQSAIREAALAPERTAAMGQAAQTRVQLYRQELFQTRWLELLETESARTAEPGP